MAIETTYFTGNTAADRATDIYNFLNDNGAGVYFDTVSLDTSGDYPTVTAKIGELTYFNIVVNSTLKLQNSSGVFLANGKFQSMSRSNSMSAYVRGYKTSSGLWLTDGDGFATNFLASLFLSKTVSGDPCAVFVNDTDSSASYSYADFNNSSVMIKSKNYNALRSAYSDGGYAPIFPVTVACPIVFDVGTYTENIIFTPISQFPSAVQIIDINGVKYVYDGFIGLKE